MAVPRTARKYRDLTGHLRELMRGLPPGGRMPSFADLKAQFGASTTTINRAFVELEQAGLVTRRQGRGVFVAEGPPRQRCYTLGFHTVSLNQRQLPFCVHLMDGVREAARQHGSEVLLLDSEPSADWAKVDGLLLYGTLGAELMRKAPLEIPAVLMLWQFADCSSVGSNDYEATRRATEYLFSLGHRRIGFLGCLDSLIVSVRLAGMRSAYFFAGMQLETRFLREMPNGPMPASGRRGMEEWLRDDWGELGCTALIVQNDHAAMGAMQALASAGVRVPRDVSVLGFDSPEDCELCPPRLTSVEIPLEQIGRRAATMLIDRIETGKKEIEHVALPAGFTVRDSTAMASTELSGPGSSVPADR